jgi:hypothetical protein
VQRYNAIFFFYPRRIGVLSGRSEFWILIGILMEYLIIAHKNKVVFRGAQGWHKAMLFLSFSYELSQTQVYFWSFNGIIF